MNDSKKLAYVIDRSVFKEMREDNYLSLRPSDAHLELINQFTMSPKTADEIVAFPTYAMNDIIDRDLDRFNPKAIRNMLKLPPEQNPIGKGFMMSHDHYSMPNGRIYHGEVKKIAGVSWGKLWVYIPKTAQYQEYIENLDFGVYWAVSVSVGMNEVSCSICASPNMSYYFGCDNGHYMGETYDGELCYRNIDGIGDFRELSQCYLGAQYNAAVATKQAKYFTVMNREAPVKTDEEKEAEPIDSPTEKQYNEDSKVVENEQPKEDNEIEKEVNGKLDGEITKEMLDEKDKVIDGISKAVEDKEAIILWLNAEKSYLEPLAVAGKVYLGDLRANVLKSYITANADPSVEGDEVNTEFISKLIDRCGDDADLLKTLADTYKVESEAKYIRSSEEEIPVEKTIVEADEDPKVNKMHGVDEPGKEVSD